MAVFLLGGEDSAKDSLNLKDAIKGTLEGGNHGGSEEDQKRPKNGLDDEAVGVVTDGVESTTGATNTMNTYTTSTSTMTTTSTTTTTITTTLMITTEYTMTTRRASTSKGLTDPEGSSSSGSGVSSSSSSSGEESTTTVAMGNQNVCKIPNYCAIFIFSSDLAENSGFGSSEYDSSEISGNDSATKIASAADVKLDLGKKILGFFSKKAQFKLHYRFR